MYIFQLGWVVFPVPPSKMTVKVKNKNKTVELIDGSEINLLQQPGLSSFDFSVLLPNSFYPFAYYPSLSGQSQSYQPSRYYTDAIKRMKEQKLVCRLSIKRVKGGTETLFYTDAMVSVEEYTLTEDAENGYDVLLDLKLKQCAPYGTKTCALQQEPTGETVAVVEEKRPDNRETPKTYTVQKGDTLCAIARRFLGDSGKYLYLAKLNHISNPNRIQIGQVIRLG